MRLLVTADFTDAGLARLRAHGDVVYEPWSETGALWMAEELAERVVADGFDALIVEVDLVHEEVFEARPLRLVGCCRGEPLNVDAEAATEAGVPVLYAPGRNARSVAELTVAFVLDLARGVTALAHRLRHGDFDPTNVKQLIAELGGARGFELGSATIGLLGLGAVARETARRLAGFGPRVIAYDPLVDDATFAAHGVERVALDALFAESDVLSLHAALTPATRGIVSAARLASMKDGAYLVNTARFGLMDGDAVLEALRVGKLRGAALDVFTIEPPTKDDPFLALPSVIATPHIGGATRDVVRHQSEMIAGDVDRLFAGERPRHVVNPEVLAAWPRP